MDNLKTSPAPKPVVKKPINPAQSNLGAKTLIMSLSVLGTMSGWGYLALTQQQAQMSAQNSQEVLDDVLLTVQNDVPTPSVVMPSAPQPKTERRVEPKAQRVTVARTVTQNPPVQAPIVRAKPASAPVVTERAAVAPAVSRAPVLREVQVQTQPKPRARTRSS